VKAPSETTPGASPRSPTRQAGRATAHEPRLRDASQAQRLLTILGDHFLPAYRHGIKTCSATSRTALCAPLHDRRAGRGDFAGRPAVGREPTASSPARSPAFPTTSAIASRRLANEPAARALQARIRATDSALYQRRRRRRGALCGPHQLAPWNFCATPTPACWPTPTCTPT